MRGLIRTAARTLIGVTFASLGLDAARDPGERVAQAAPLLATLRRFLPLPGDDALIVRGNGAAQMAAGAMLATGKAQDLAALTLVGSLIPTTAAGHAFWTCADPKIRKMQRIQFQKNLTMIGGLLFAALEAFQRRNRRRSSSSL